MTQAQMILQYMADNGSISAAEAFYHLGITRLSARIFDLRKAGHRIVNETVTGVNRHGARVRYDRYRVEREDE